MHPLMRPLMNPSLRLTSHLLALDDPLQSELKVRGGKSGEASPPDMVGGKKNEEGGNHDGKGKHRRKDRVRGARQALRGNLGGGLGASVAKDGGFSREAVEALPAFRWTVGTGSAGLRKGVVPLLIF